MNCAGALLVTWTEIYVSEYTPCTFIWPCLTGRTDRPDNLYRTGERHGVSMTEPLNDGPDDDCAQKFSHQGDAIHQRL